MLAVAFVSFLQRIPHVAVPYFITALILISIFFVVWGIRRGCLYYYDFINISLFPVFLATWLLSPQKETAWLISHRGHIIYPLFAVASIAPRMLSLPAFHLVWKGNSTAIPTVFVVLWGATFLLSSIMLWLGAPIRTPVLVILVLTIPTRIALARELNMTKDRIWKLRFRSRENRDRNP